MGFPTCKDNIMVYWQNLAQNVKKGYLNVILKQSIDYIKEYKIFFITVSGPT